MQNNTIHFFTVRDKCFAYDINTTACAEVDAIALSILSEMLSGNNVDLEEKYAHAYRQSELRESIRQCEVLLSTGMFGVKPVRYRHHIQNDLLAVCLHISHHCNMKCKYCYADAGSFGRERGLMSREIMLKAVDFAFTHSKGNPSLDIGFFGGEPLLNFKLIRESVSYAKQLAEKRDKRVTFSMTSNATLLTDEIMDFISEENFSLIFSIDGPKKVHDQMRKYCSGKGTHSDVLKNVKQYSNNYSDNFTVRGTFTKTTPNFSNQVLFLNDQGFESISVEPVQLHAAHPCSISTDGDILRIKLEYNKLADLYLERFDEGRPLHFFHFDYVLRKLISPQPMHTECGAGGGFIAITPDGKIFPCFETVVEEENCIGHIDSGFDKQKRRRFQRIHVDVKKECRECWLKYSCGGGCHAFNIRYNNNINIPYKPYCEFAKHRFKLAAWILSKIMERGETAVEKLKIHLGIV
jgi:uncharacterized protein